MTAPLSGRPRPASAKPASPKGPSTRPQEAAKKKKVSVPPEILRQVKLIELRTRGLVNSVFTGEYRSVFKGQGMEFSEVREYQPGDEVRSIDWNVTARMRRPFVKRYIEERELTVMLAVDLSGSERFGTVKRFKSELATELGAVLAMSAVRNNDRVGIILFTDQIEHVVPPRKGRRHALRLVRDLLVHEPVGTKTDVAGAMNYMLKMLNHHTIIFVISDFIDADIERPLKILSAQHDVVAITVEDPSETNLPELGLVRLTDPETNQTIDIDTSDATVRSQYAKRVGEERAARQHLLRRLAIDEIVVRTDAGIIEPLMRFFPVARNEVEAPVNALLFALLLPFAQDPQSEGVRMGVTVLPETVTVGTPFRVLVRIRAPRGATIAFPAATDSLGGVELLDPRTVRAAADSSAIDQTATYRLAAWDVGALPIALGNVVVDIDGVEQRIPIDSVSINVASVLPADTTKREPKPARDLMDTPASMWRWWLIGAAVALLLALLLWAWLRRRRVDPNSASALDPYAFAQKEFTRIESLGLVEAGERERFVALMVEVVRDYLARRVTGATAALTSTELLQALRAEPTVPVHRLAPMLAESDLVKFARAPLTAERAKLLGEEAKAIVQEVDEAQATAAKSAAMKAAA